MFAPLFLINLCSYATTVGHMPLVPQHPPHPPRETQGDIKDNSNGAWIWSAVSFCIKFNDNYWWSKTVLVLLPKTKQNKKTMSKKSVTIYCLSSTIYWQSCCWCFCSETWGKKWATLIAVWLSCQMSDHWSQMVQRMTGWVNMRVSWLSAFKQGTQTRSWQTLEYSLQTLFQH